MESLRTSSERWPVFFQVAGLVVGVVAIVLTVYFSVRAERTKSLTVRYLGERPLISVDGRATQQLQISLGGQLVRSPWLFSIRLENSGNQPIETRDIEAPPHLAFSSASVVGAEIVGRSQPALAASVAHKDGIVTIQHGLLNPGDWIAVDVLVDGDPGVPSVSARISGISVLSEVRPAPGPSIARATLFPLPLPLTYAMLIIASLASAVLLLTSVAGIALAVKPVFRRLSKRTIDQDKDQLAVPSLTSLTMANREANVVFAFLGEGGAVGLLDDPQALASTIAQRVPVPVLNSVGLNAQTAARTLGLHLKSALRLKLAQELHGKLPGGAGKRAWDELMKLDPGSVSTGVLVERAQGLYRQFLPFDGTNFGIGLALMAVSLAVISVLGGTWRTLLGA